jgi:hypothetical protein
MIRSNRCMVIFAAAVVGLASAGCATQSDAFRRMTAEDHERAANLPDPPGDPTPSDHLAIARELREREQSACADVPEAERDRGPLSRRDRIAAVEPLSERAYPKEMPQPAGVAVYLRASPGVTEQWLGRVIECHLAHHAVVGDRMPDPVSPLFVDDARVALSSTGDGFRIAITARDVTTARAIIERARALVE